MYYTTKPVLSRVKFKKISVTPHCMMDRVVYCAKHTADKNSRMRLFRSYLLKARSPFD